jgi:hypothetical protein
MATYRVQRIFSGDKKSPSFKDFLKSSGKLLGGGIGEGDVYTSQITPGAKKSIGTIKNYLKSKKKNGNISNKEKGF